MGSLKYYIPGESPTQISQYGAYASKFLGLVPSRRLSDADIIIFKGGADVNPELYGETLLTAHGVYINKMMDTVDTQAFLHGLKHGKMMLGICRGAQFLTVMAGGRLIQDVDNHALAGMHLITTHDHSVMPITSTHHQMMYPFNLEHHRYKLLAWSTYPLASQYNIGKDSSIIRTENGEAKMPLKSSIPIIAENMRKTGLPEIIDRESRFGATKSAAEHEKKQFYNQATEPEIVWYPEINGLAIQGHPEKMMDYNIPGFHHWIAKTFFKSFNQKIHFVT